MSWRNATIVLALLAMWLLWRDCTRPAAAPADATSQRCTPELRTVTEWGSTDRATPADDEQPTPAAADEGGLSFNGFKIPGWAMWFAPHPGEDLHAYKDRMLPLAQAAIAPHRSRVARSREDFATLAHLDNAQRAALDTAAKQAADQLEEKALGAILNGDFNPSTFKPMTAVSTARDMLDVVDKANQKFVGSLNDQQRAQLAQHPFDFADYLVFSTKWEDMLNAFN